MMMPLPKSAGFVVLQDVVWKTTDPIGTARLRWRPLLAREWAATVEVKHAVVLPLILVHPAASVVDGVVCNRAANLDTSLTVRGLLAAISRMTVKRGARRIGDHVFFEGIHEVGPRAYTALIGS